MKRRKWKVFVSGMLAASMLLSCACKKKDGSDASSSFGSPNVNNNENPNNNIDYTADVVEEDDPFYENEESKLTIPVDSSKELESLEADQYPSFLGDYIALGYMIQYEVPPEVQEQLSSFNYPEEVEQYHELAIQYYYDGVAIFTSSGEYLYTLISEADTWGGAPFVLPDGRLAMVEIMFEGEGFGLGVAIFDEAGQFVERKTWTVEEQGVFFDRYNTSSYSMPDGKTVLITTNGIALLDENGQNIWIYDGPDANDIGTTVFMQGGFVIDGKPYALLENWTYQDDDSFERSRMLLEIDMATGEETGDPLPLADVLPDTLFQGDNACYGISANGIVKVDLFTGDREAVINWNETDVNYMKIAQETCRVSSSGDVYFSQIVSDTDNPENVYLQVLRFYKAEKNPHAGKTILHLSANGLYSEALLDCIVEYNKKPDGKARVLTYDYRDDMDGTLGAFQSAEADLAYRVSLDMKSGIGPDILMNFSNFGEFENEDVLLNLNTYIDGSNGLDRSLYFDNVFRAYESNGKLFQMPLLFRANCLLVDSTFSGSRYGWTYSDFLAQLNQLPSGKTAFYNMSAEDMLDAMLSNDISYFVDYNGCEARFDSEEFKTLLEVAAKCNVKHDIAEYLDDMKHDPIYNAITQDICVMGPMHLFSVADSIGYVSDINGGNVAYVGYPSASGSGMSAEATMSIGISSFSKHPDEAWDFIRSLLETDIMVELSHGGNNPVNREAEDILCQNEIDFFNEMKEKYPNDPLMWHSLPIDASSAAEYVDLLNHISTKSGTYPTILNIVKEEAAAYFAGSKSAEDVVKIIQDRVTTVLQESQ